MLRATSGLILSPVDDDEHLTAGPSASATIGASDRVVIGRNRPRDRSHGILWHAPPPSPRLPRRLTSRTPMKPNGVMTPTPMRGCRPSLARSTQRPRTGGLVVDGRIRARSGERCHVDPGARDGGVAAVRDIDPSVAARSLLCVDQSTSRGRTARACTALSVRCDWRRASLTSPKWTKVETGLLGRPARERPPT